MTPEAASIVVAIIGLAGTALAAWLANSARHHAYRAQVNAKPVSNGFAGEVRDNLAKILVVATEARDEATRAHDKIDEHLQAHANAHIYQFSTPAAREAQQ